MPSPDKIRQQASFFKTAFSHCINDLDLGESVTPCYNLDFQLLFPYLFPTPVDQIKPSPTVYKNIFRSLSRAVDHKVDFKLVMSGASVMELLDQIVHRKHHLRRQFQELAKYCDRLARGERVNEFDLFIDRPGVLQALQIVTDSGFDAEIRGPISTMRNLIMEQRITPIGELVDVSEVTDADYAEYESIVGFMRQKRGRRDRDRSQRDSEFHYKVDALNVMLSKMVNRTSGSDAQVLFTTTTDENVQILTSSDHVYARNPCVPLFILNATVLRQNRLIRSEKEFFVDAVRHAESVLERMGDASDWDSIPLFDALKAEDFFKTYVHFLNHETLTNGHSVNLPDKDAVIQALTDKSRVNDVLHEAQSEYDRVGQDLNGFLNDFEEGVAEKFHFRDDPIVQRIEQDLGLAKRS